MIGLPPRSTLYPNTTLFRSSRSNAGEIDNLEAWLVTVVGRAALNMLRSRRRAERREEPLDARLPDPIVDRADGIDPEDRKSTRLNSSHANISYAVFCLKKKI